MKILNIQVDDRRWKARQALENVKPPKSNLTRVEKLVIKTLQNDYSRVLPADKGNATILMDMLEYSGIGKPS